MKKTKEVDPIKAQKIKIGVFSTIGILLIIFALIILFVDSIAVNLILYTTCIGLFLLGIARFVTMFKNIGVKLKIYVNLIEAIINVAIGIIILLIIPNPELSGVLVGVYCYLLSAVLFGRGLVFLIEGMYCAEKKTVIHFIIHLALIVTATVFIAHDLTLTQLRFVMFVIALLITAICAFEVLRSIKRYRKEVDIKHDNDIREEAKSEARQEMKKDLEEIIDQEIKEEKDDEVIEE